MQHGSLQLKAWLDRANLKQRPGAKRLRIHYTYLNQLLNRRRFPSREMATRLEDETGIPVAAWSTRVGKSKTGPSRQAKLPRDLQGANV